jgi:hypothetical protein
VSKQPDYRVRPAKHVQRLLIVDALRRLRAFYPLVEYSYVGFGAQYFVDFVLFHRALGIRDMTSLESDKQKYQRCVFNKPFDSVDVIEGTSWEHFGSMDFERPVIVWPDYVDSLDAPILGDIDTLALRMRPGSVAMVTVNVDPDEVETPPHGRRALLEERVGAVAVPHGVRDADLDGWDNAAVIRRIIDEQFRRSVSDRADGCFYEQFFNFQYRDGARMLTVGGMILDDALRPAFDACDWDAVDGYRSGADALRIELPSLTLRELAHLDAQLPKGIDAMTGPGLGAEDLAAYAEFYRYYPRYALVDV